MPCYTPLNAYYGDQLTKSGKRDLKVVKKQELEIRKAITPGFVPLTIPCGQCIGCRLEKSKNWAIRCMHEAQLYEDNSFLTLTYSDENIPQYGSLVPEHMHTFWKALRYECSEKKSNPETGKLKRYYKKLRYLQCGEYGDETQRPHYHAILFNHSFPDKKYHSMSGDNPVFTSDTLTQLWGRGHALIGTVTFDSAAYVSRYVTKKVTGELAHDHYNTTDPYTGEIAIRHPEFATMSRRPGIGYEWYKKYKSDVYPRDEVIYNGIKTKPPSYYDSLYELEDAMHLFELKQLRAAKVDRSQNTPERLEAKRRVKEAQLTFLKNTI